MVIPAYNESACIARTVQDARRVLTMRGWQVEVVVVDDGSTDGTLEVLRTMRDAWLNVASFSQNHGKGFAVRIGCLCASNPNILMLDADHSVHAKELNTPGEVLAGRQRYFVLKGSREQVVKQPLYRLFAGKVWQALVWLKTGMWMDTQCPFMFMRLPRTFFKKLYINGFAFDVELLKNAKKHNYEVIVQQVRYYNRKDSKVTILKTVAMFYDLLKV